MRGVRFEVEARPELLSGRPPAFARRVLDGFVRWGPRAKAMHRMRCTVRVQQGWLWGFEVDVCRDPGTSRLTVFVDPCCRLGEALIPWNAYAFLGMTGLLFLGSALGSDVGRLLPRTTAHAAWLVTSAIFLPLFIVQWAAIRLVVRTDQRTLEEVGDAVRNALA